MFEEAYGYAYEDNPTLKLTQGTNYHLLLFGEDGIAQVENDAGHKVIVHESWFELQGQI